MWPNELDNFSFQALLIATVWRLELQVNFLHYSSRHKHYFTIWEIDNFHLDKESMVEVQMWLWKMGPLWILNCESLLFINHKK